MGLRMAKPYTNRTSGLAEPASVDAMRLDAAEQLNQIGFLTWSADGRGAQASAIAQQMFGLPPEVAISALTARVPPAELASLMSLWQEATGGRQRALAAEFSADPLTEGGDGLRISAELRFTYAPDGSLNRCVVALQDITSQSAMLKALSDSEARLEEAQQIAHLGYWELDFEKHRTVMSDQALRMWGLPENWCTDGRGLVDLVPADQRDWVVELYTQAFARRDTSLRYELRVTAADGVTRDFHSQVKIDYRADHRPRRLLATVQDITELKSYRRQLHSLSFFDPVTSLPNRALFVDRLNQALNDASWQGQQLGIVMLDLDRFKDINDSLGHTAGDALLQQAAQRLLQVMRGYDTVARLGGDEFAVMLPGVRHASDMDAIAQKILGAFSEPFLIAGQQVFVTTSVGGAAYPNDAKDAVQLMQYADAALYHAKSQGRNNFRVYSSELTRQASERLSLESELRQAIEAEQLSLHYQPKFDLASGHLVGAEALMRWQHPHKGMVPPLNFIPMAEDTGLIVAMGAWALRTACLAAAQWNLGREQPLKIAVNLSARQFVGVPFSQTVKEALESSGCRPEWLELEITESLLLDGTDEIRVILEDIAALGVSIALDDFGTGYSALSYLTRFPVATLKIDRSFIKDLPGDRGSAELVKAIVSLGHSLNMNLVAEGVETREQAHHLEDLGCQLVQGYLYGRPLPHEAFTTLASEPAAA